MTNAKKILILKNQLSKSNEIKNNNELRKWYTDTKEYVGSIYGYDSIQYKKFRIYNSKPSPSIEKTVYELTTQLESYILVLKNTPVDMDKLKIEVPITSTSTDILTVDSQMNKLPKDKSKIFILIGSIIGTFSELATILDWFKITPKILFDTLKNLFK